MCSAMTGQRDIRPTSDTQGTSYGAPCELENVLAKIVIDRVPSIEMVRFVNSGTEACLSVLRLMRAYTKRDKVCYRTFIVVTCPHPWGKEHIK